MLSNTMLDTLANSGAEIDDTPFILKAQETCRQIQIAIERAIDEGEVTIEDVFDRDYQIVEGIESRCNMTSASTRPPTSYVRPSSIAPRAATAASSARRSAT